LVVTVGTGIGAGIILDRRVWRGPNRRAGDLGHIAVSGADGSDAACACGRRGCLQLAASGRTLDAIGVAHDVGGGRGVLAAAENGTGWAVDALARCGRLLGEAAGNAAVLLDLQAIIIGGGLGSKLGEPWWSALVDAVGRRTHRDGPTVEVRRARLGDDAAIIGVAAATAHRRES
jgi:glucokinase